MSLQLYNFEVTLVYLYKYSGHRFIANTIYVYKHRIQTHTVVRIDNNPMV